MDNKFTRIISFLSFFMFLMAFQCQEMESEMEALAIEGGCRFQCSNEKTVSSFSKLKGKVVKIPVELSGAKEDSSYIYGITIYEPDFNSSSFTKENILLPCETFPDKFLQNNLMVIIEGKLTNCCGLLKSPDSQKRFGCKIILKSIRKK